MVDVVIIGGGPAGATLARLIGKNCKVVLIEKRTFLESSPISMHKCCGGLIAPDAQKILASFGLGLPKSVIQSPQMFAVRTIDIKNGLERYYQRHYINIDREKFDQWLESLIPESVDVINGGIFLSYEEEDDGITVRYRYREKECSIKTKLLVGADGAFSKVRRLAFPLQAAPHRYIAIQEWYRTSGNVNYYGAVFDEEITDFYAWTIPKEDYLILGAALRDDKGAHRKFDLLKRKLQIYGFDFGKSEKRNAAYLLRPVHTRQIFGGRGSVALAGEAAGWISPSSAEGMSYAFRSAVALAGAVNEDLGAWCGLYHKGTAQLRRDILLKNIKSPAMYNNSIRKMIMSTGIQSIRMEL